MAFATDLEVVREAVDSLDLKPSTSPLWKLNPALAADLSRRLRDLVRVMDRAALACLEEAPALAVAEDPLREVVQRWRNAETLGAAVRLQNGELWLREGAIDAYRLLLEKCTALEAERRLQRYGPFTPHVTGRTEKWGP